MGQEAFVGEIFMFGGNFAMVNTTFCNGQILAISQNTALFSLLGTNYGGNGMSTFALPNLQGNVPVGQGTSNYGQNFPVGDAGGSAGVTLLSTEMPLHDHNNQLNVPAVNTGAGTGTGTLVSDPIGAYPAVVASGTNLYSNVMGAGSMTPLISNLDANTSFSGGNQPHNNMQPYLAVTFVIALQGVFPARN